MTIIEEMRAALPPYVDIKRVREWADRLERSGALVPVPDGGAIDVGHAPLGIGFTVDGHSGIFRRVGCGCGGTPIESYVILKRAESDDDVRVPHHTIVQPVRLVPIAEAGI